MFRSFLTRTVFRPSGSAVRAATQTKFTSIGAVRAMGGGHGSSAKSSSHDANAHDHHDDEPHVSQVHYQASRFLLVSCYLWIMWRIKEDKGQLFGLYQPWLHEHEHEHPTIAYALDDDMNVVAKDVHDDHGHHDDHHDEEHH